MAKKDQVIQITRTAISISGVETGINIIKIKNSNA